MCVCRNRLGGFLGERVLDDSEREKIVRELKQLRDETLVVIPNQLLREIADEKFNRMLKSISREMVASGK